MAGSLEYCPACGGMREITVTIGMQTNREMDDEETTRILYHYHCRSCNTYLCSRVYIEEQPVIPIMEAPKHAEFLG